MQLQVCSVSITQKTILPPESIIDLYKDVPLYKAWTWLEKGDRADSSGCWTKGVKVCRSRITAAIFG